MCLVSSQSGMEHTPVSSPTTVSSGVIVQSCAQVVDDGGRLLAGGVSASVGSLSDSNLSSTTVTTGIGAAAGDKPKITTSAAGSTTATPVKASSGALTTSSAATSCVASPVLSPPRKIWGRNNNGTSK